MYRPLNQCWHCGKFKKFSELTIRRHWEDGEIVDQYCQKCKQKMQEKGTPNA